MNDLRAHPISTESIQGVNNTNMGGNGFNPKDSKLTEYQQVYRAFYSDKPKNALQISIETGIRRANITRYIGRMKRTDRIAVVYIGMCPITKHGKVQFLTTKFDEILNKEGVRR